MELGVFLDDLTLRFTRTYPVPAERVWRALVDEASDWFAVRPVTIEPGVGGAAVFGPVDEPYWSQVVAEWVEPTTLAFGHPDVPQGGALRFDLSDVDGGCELVFTQSFRPGGTFAPEERYGTDHPAGTHLPWRPGFVSGFHLMFEHLGHHLGGEPVAEPERRWQEVLVPMYREHIRTSLASES